MMYHMTASMGRDGNGKSFFTPPSSVSNPSSNDGIEVKPCLKVKIKQEPNSAGVSYKFPIELDNSDEEDDFELKKGERAMFETVIMTTVMNFTKMLELIPLRSKMESILK